MNVNQIFNVFSKKEKEISEISCEPNNLNEKLRKGEYNLVIDQARYPIGSLLEVFKDYNLNPDYQRRVVWENDRKSRLIESLIVNVPIPPVFLYEVDYNKYEVMDGLQRISSITQFLRGEYELESLELWGELNGKRFQDLPEDFQNTIKRRYLSATIIVKESTTDTNKEAKLKRFVFERLNTGGIKLSDQEIRNALYTGKFNDLINELSESDIFLKLVNTSKKTKSSISNPVDRMENRELVLRFFAYKDILINDSTGETRKILDHYAKKNTDLDSKSIEALRDYFYKVFELIYAILGDRAFCKSKKTSFEKMLYDTVTQSCSILLDRKIPGVENKKIDSQTVYSFFACNKKIFNGKYTDFSNVKKRVNSFDKFLMDNLNA